MLLNELDLHLLGEGNHRTLWHFLGAVPHGIRADEPGVRFAVWAPNATAVRVVGDWNQWGAADGTVPGGDVLHLQGSSGVWAADVEHAYPGNRYKLAITGADGRTVLKADPMAMASECPPANASVVACRSQHVWGDHEWMQARRVGPGNPLRIYEVHAASWRPGLSYRELGEQLADHVSDLGFTHVEFLPLAEHPFGGSWGYQVTGYFAPTARFGEPDDLRALVDTLHQRGIGVIIDWVPAHFPKDEWSLARFDGTALYEHADPRQGEHPDWGTLVFNYGRNEVRNFLVSNALYWLREFHIDGLRVDAVASMLYLDYSRGAGQWVPNRDGGRENLDAVAFLRELNSVVAVEAPGTMVVAEESTAWPQVSHPVDQGGLGFSHKWNMGWMHDTLGYFANESVHRRWHHRDLSFGLLYAFSERFVLPLSHDEVVHGKGSLLAKMSGDDWQRFATLRALYGWMWAMPGAPLLFMGAELAPWTEWSESSSLPWHLLDHAPHRGVRDTLVALNAAADRWRALWERDHEASGFQWLDADNADHSVYAFVRWGHAGSSAVVCIGNFTPVPRPGYRVGVPWAGAWEVVVDTDAARFGGSGFRGDVARELVSAESDGAAAGPAGTSGGGIFGFCVAEPTPWQGQPMSIVVDAPPLATVLIAARRP